MNHRQRHRRCTVEKSPTNPSRRSLLSGICVVGAGSLLTRGKLWSQVGSPRRLDLHHHFGSPRWIKKIAEVKRQGWQQFQNFSPAKTVETLDKAGVSTPFLSVTEPGVWFGDDFSKERQDAIGMARDMNDYGARMVSDHVLFDTGKYTLRPGAREKLAKVSGIISGHPGLRLEVEGHTDSVGGDEYNQRLSEQRAGSVRDYLVQQGIASNSVTAKGFGKTRPIVSNDTATGRQQNRRVELVVSGEIIGTEIGRTTIR